MNAKQILPMVEEALSAASGGEVNLYDFATRVCEAQKEQDAKIAEAAGETAVAASIRAAP